MQKAGERRIVYSDLDGNGHVDNARYIEMAADVLSEQMVKSPLKTLQVVFNKETMLGDKMELYSKETPGGTFVKGVTDGKDNFICLLTFEEDGHV